MGRLFNKLKEYLYIPSFKNPTQLTYDIARIVFSLFFSIVSFYFARTLYFAENPLLEINYLGSTLSAILSFALIYFLIPLVIKAVAEGIRLLLQQSLRENLAQIIEDVTKYQPKKVPKIDTVKTSPVLLDTSSIIDARICGIIEQGFIDAEVVVPQFVLDELHLISDSKSKLKRDKGKRGLLVLEELKALKGKDFKVYPTKTSKNVDKSLVSLANKLKARIATVDYNLNKVANVKDVKVLNVNSLANILKTVVIPGDKIKVKLVKKGKEEGQGIGFFEDGTMIVVASGSKYIKKEVNCLVSKVLQTDAGQMIFADLDESNKVN